MKSSLFSRALYLPIILPQNTLNVSIKKEMVIVARSRIAALKSAPKFLVDNVAKFYAESPNLDWDVREIPNWAPPFELFWMEWNDPRKWFTKEGITESDIEAQGGISCRVLMAEPSFTIETVKTFLTKFTGLPWSDPSGVDVVELLPRTKWILALDTWISAKPVNGLPIWNGQQALIFLDQSGKFLGRLWAGLGVYHALETGLTKDEVMTYAEGFSHIFGLALSFLHCKNVKVNETLVPSAKPGSPHPKGQRPPTELTYKVLNIEPMRKILRSEGDSDRVGVKRALHICRGHFASYLPEAPLFGKVSGTFWIPDHVRGSKDFGEVRKDYNVSPPGV